MLGVWALHVAEVHGVSHRPVCDGIMAAPAGCGWRWRAWSGEECEVEVGGCGVWGVTCNESSPDHMAHANVPKVASFSLGRRQRGNTSIEIKPQMVAVAASPKELVDLHVTVGV